MILLHLLLGRREDKSPQEALNLKGKERVPKTSTDNVQSTATPNQVDKANFQQPEDYVVSLPEPGNHVLEITNKCSGGKFIIITPIYMYNV